MLEQFLLEKSVGERKRGRREITEQRWENNGKTWLHSLPKTYGYLQTVCIVGNEYSCVDTTIWWGLHNLIVNGGLPIVDFSYNPHFSMWCWWSISIPCLGLEKGGPHVTHTALFSISYRYMYYYVIKTLIHTNCVLLELQCSYSCTVADPVFFSIKTLLLCIH